MHKKALLALALISVLAVIGAMWLTHQRRAVTTADGGGPLAAGLTESVNAVTRVLVEDGAQSLTLERGESGWQVAERGGYPADMQQLRRKLLALSDSTLVEKKTANPDNYALLGVADPQPREADADTEADTEPVRLTLEGLPEPLSLIIGKTSFRGNQSSTYVRRAGEGQSWMASGDLSMSADPKQWLKRDVLDLGTARVQRVVLTHPDGSVMTLQKASSESPNFELLNLPEGRELLSPSSPNSIAGALGSLRLDDVRPATEGDAAGSPTVQGVFETFDGLRVHTRAWEQDDQRYLTLNVEFDPALIPPPAEAAEPAEPAEDAANGDAAESGVDNAVDDAAHDPAVADQGLTETAIDEPDAAPIDQAALEAALAGEAEALAAAVNGWVFTIPSYKYGNLTKKLEDLLKPPESAATAQ